MSGDEAYEEWLRDATDEEVDIEFGVQGMKYSDDGQVVSSDGWSDSQKEAIRKLIMDVADAVVAILGIEGGE